MRHYIILPMADNEVPGDTGPGDTGPGLLFEEYLDVLGLLERVFRLS